MMPKTLEGVKDLFDSANEKQRGDYLLVAMTLLRDEMRVSFDRMNGEIKMINQKCLARREICEEVINSKINTATKPLCDKQKMFLSKNEAKVYGFLLLAFSVGVGVGTGVITWYELVKRGLP